MAEFITTRNTISGIVGTVPAHYLTMSPFKDYLVAESEGAKDFTPEMYKPKTVGEFVEAHPAKGRKAKDKADETADEIGE